MRSNISVALLMLACVVEICVNGAPQEMSEEPMGAGAEPMAGAGAGAGVGAGVGAQVGAQFRIGLGTGFGAGLGAGLGAKFGLGANMMGMGQAGAGFGGTGGMLRRSDKSRFEAGLRYGQVYEKYGGQVHDEGLKFDGAHGDS